jgi:hypothetical protein
MMTNLAVGLLISASLFASAAFAQGAPAPAPAPTPSTAPGKVVEGVTVTGRRLPGKSCSSRDQACIATVVAELKAHYPKLLQQWCDHVEERAMMNNMEFMEINLDRPHPNVQPYMPPAVTKVACAVDRKH